MMRSAAWLVAAWMISSPAEPTPLRVAEPLIPGRHDLKLETVRDGTLYVPRNYTPSGSIPLLLWLHGAGGSGQVSDALAGLADQYGYAVLAPDSRDWTWDGILGRWGPDVEFIQDAMRYTFERCNIDRERIWVAGFSDGASYALSFGISHGTIFRRIMAFSPGVMQPVAAPGKPPIFISHGIQDQTMPIDITSRAFVPRLKKLGYDVTYREYEGRHQLPPEVLREAFEWLKQ